MLWHPISCAQKMKKYLGRPPLPRNTIRMAKEPTQENNEQKTS